MRQFFVTIHGLFEIRFWFVVLARKKQVLISNEACEAGTPHTASDRSIEDAAYVRSTDGLWSDVWRAVNRNFSVSFTDPLRRITYLRSGSFDLIDPVINRIPLPLSEMSAPPGQSGRCNQSREARSWQSYRQ